jgi:hypothetical protein
MISINRCNTVLYLLEKIIEVLLLLWPLMLFCNLAQMDLFENLFYYNKWVLNKKLGLSNTEYGDIQRIYKSK